MATRRMNKDILEICNEKNDVILCIKEVIDNQTMIISLKGEINNEVSHDFEDELMTVVSVFSNIILDCKELNYIASKALSSLLSVQQIIDESNNSKMTLINLSQSVMETLKEAGLDQILLIEND